MLTDNQINMVKEKAIFTLTHRVKKLIRFDQFTTVAYGEQ